MKKSIKSAFRNSRHKGREYNSKIFMKLINWAVLVLGLWILLSPFVLAFSGLSSAMWSNVISGVLIVIFALWSLFGSGGNGNSSSAMPQ